jgi:hypothetical protein
MAAPQSTAELLLLTEPFPDCTGLQHSAFIAPDQVTSACKPCMYVRMLKEDAMHWSA